MDDMAMDGFPDQIQWLLKRMLGTISKKENDQLEAYIHGCPEIAALMDKLAGPDSTASHGEKGTLPSWDSLDQKVFAAFDAITGVRTSSTELFCPARRM